MAKFLDIRTSFIRFYSKNSSFNSYTIIGFYLTFPLSTSCYGLAWFTFTYRVDQLDIDLIVRPTLELGKSELPVFRVYVLLLPVFGSIPVRDNVIWKKRTFRESQISILRNIHFKPMEYGHCYLY